MILSQIADRMDYAWGIVWNASFVLDDRWEIYWNIDKDLANTMVLNSTTGLHKLTLLEMNRNLQSHWIHIVQGHGTSAWHYARELLCDMSKARAGYFVTEFTRKSTWHFHTLK